MKKFIAFAILFVLIQAIIVAYCLHVGLVHGVEGSDPNKPLLSELRESENAPPESERSGRWPTVRKHFLEAHPTCEGCGRDFNLNVHHIVPFHTNPSLELSVANLITLCAGDDATNSDGDRWADFNCHFYLGHDPDGPSGPRKSNWKLSNPNVRKDAKKHLIKQEAGR